MVWGSIKKGGERFIKGISSGNKMKEVLPGVANNSYIILLLIACGIVFFFFHLYKLFKERLKTVVLILLFLFGLWIAVKIFLPALI